MRTAIYQVIDYVLNFLSLQAKKIPIEHILASNRNSVRSGANGSRGEASQQSGVNLDEGANKAKDACNC